MVEETSLVVQNVGSGFIYIRVMKQHILQNAYFLEKSPKTDLLHRNWFFAIFSRKIQIS
jgi:hypothetical protein